jgi:hypothetical protein
MPAFEPAARYAGPRAGMVFTTRDGATGYYADAAAQLSRSRRADDASSSSASSLGGRDAKRRREKRREKKERKREKKKRKKEKKRRKKEKRKRKRSASSSSSSSSGSDVVRSAVSGKRIKLKVDKSAEDRARDAGRREMLRYMNAVSER